MACLPGAPCPAQVPLVQDRAQVHPPDTFLPVNYSASLNPKTKLTLPIKQLLQVVINHGQCLFFAFWGFLLDFQQELDLALSTHSLFKFLHPLNATLHIQ